MVGKNYASVCASQQMGGKRNIRHRINKPSKTGFLIHSLFMGTIYEQLTKLMEQIMVIYFMKIEMLSSPLCLTHLLSL